MKILNQIAIILSIGLIGEVISNLIKNIIVIPGSVIGMILLFILLQNKILKEDSIKEVGEFLLSNMAIFFIPAGVSLIASIDLIKANLIPLSIIIVVSTIVVMYSSGKVVDIMISKRHKE